MLAVGSVLAARYELKSVLGKGGMGLVYKAWDRLLEEEVAIKVLRTDLTPDINAAKRFRSEIKLARRVSHPNICRIHDYGEEGPLGYISMEILSGQDLAKRLSTLPEGLPSDEALSSLLQIAEGLQAIHDVGVLHRDLKPANAIRDERGVIRLMDFGIAKELVSQSATGTGQTLGTPEYMSPEQCRGEDLDFPSDVYALAIVGYELFTGTLPLRGATHVATIFKQLQENPSFDGPVGSRIPRTIVPVLAKALSKEPGQRYPSAREFADALRQASEASAMPTSAIVIDRAAVVTPPPSGPQPSNRDRRIHDRFEMPTEVWLYKLNDAGGEEKKERTIAHDISRRGMRILSTWKDIQVGERLKVSEAHGDFSPIAIVRNLSFGADHVTRIGVEFVGGDAPDRLVGVSSNTPPSTRATSVQRPTPRPNTPQPVTPSRTSTPTPPLRAPTPPPLSATRGPAPVAPAGARFSSLNANLDRLSTGDSGKNKVVSVFPPPSPEKSAKIDAALAAAQRLLAEVKVSEAIQKLNEGLALARGTSRSREVRMALAEAEAKNPRLRTKAHHDLEDLSREDPENPAVHCALGRVLRVAGNRQEARAAFERVLALDPGNREAQEALASIR